MRLKQLADTASPHWPTCLPEWNLSFRVRAGGVGVACLLGWLACLGTVGAQSTGSPEGPRALGGAATNTGAVWAWRNPLPTGNSLRGVVYGSSTFVAVGNQGTVVSAPDGMQWTQQTSGTTSSLNGVAYGNGRFVAVGGFDASPQRTNVVLTSPDGRAWTPRNSGSTNILLGVAYGKGLFVAVGIGDAPASSVIMTSPDGIAWKTRDQGSFGELHAITYGSGLFVAVGAHGWIVTSSDGIQWTVPNNGDPGTINGIAYGNGMYVAVGDGAKVLTSPDAGTWSTQSSDLDPHSDLLAVTYANGVFAAVGRLDAVTGLAAKSPDGITWTPLNLGDTESLYGVVFGQNSFCAVGDHDTLLTSSTGAVWTPRRVGATVTVRDVTFGGGIYVAAGGLATLSGEPATNTSATLLTSTNGLNWTALLPNSPATLNGVGYANGTYVAVGELGTILSSPDAKTWTVRNRDETASLQAVSYATGIFVVVGDSILTSTDGLSWTRRTAPVSARLNTLAYGNGMFVAAGAENTVLTSPNGMQWTARDLDTFDAISLSAVCYGNGLFVAVGSNPFGANPGGAVFTSRDGTAWTQQDSGFPEALTGVAYSGGSFVATGGWFDRSGSVLTSTNGVLWSPQASGTLNVLYAVRAVNGALMAVGGQGTILQSGVSLPLPPAVRFPAGGVVRMANGIVRVSVETGARGQLVVLASADCSLWQTVTNLTVRPDGAYVVTDAPPKGAPRRFYRARLTPQ